MSDKEVSRPKSNLKHPGRFSMGYCCDGGNGEKHSADCPYRENKNLGAGLYFLHSNFTKQS